MPHASLANQPYPTSPRAWPASCLTCVYPFVSGSYAPTPSQNVLAAAWPAFDGLPTPNATMRMSPCACKTYTERGRRARSTHIITHAAHGQPRVGFDAETVHDLAKLALPVEPAKVADNIFFGRARVVTAVARRARHVGQLCPAAGGRGEGSRVLETVTDGASHIDDVGS